MSSVMSAKHPNQPDLVKATVIFDQGPLEAIITMTQDSSGQGCTLSGTINGLTDTLQHGFAVQTAAPPVNNTHFDPTNGTQVHKAMNALGGHSGDLDNVFAPQLGSPANSARYPSNLAVIGEFSCVGHPLAVHDGADDLVTPLIGCEGIVNSWGFIGNSSICRINLTIVSPTKDVGPISTLATFGRNNGGVALGSVEMEQLSNNTQTKANGKLSNLPPGSYELAIYDRLSFDNDGKVELGVILYPLKDFVINEGDKSYVVHLQPEVHIIGTNTIVGRWLCIHQQLNDSKVLVAYSVIGIYNNNNCFINVSVFPEAHELNNKGYEKGEMTYEKEEL